MSITQPILSYASAQKSRRNTQIAIVPLALALTPLLATAIAYLAPEAPVPTLHIMLLGSLVSPCNFILAAGMAIMFRHQRAPFVISVVASLIALANAGIVIRELFFGGFHFGVC